MLLHYSVRAFTCLTFRCNGSLDLRSPNGVSSKPPKSMPTQDATFEAIIDHPGVDTVVGEA